MRTTIAVLADYSSISEHSKLNVLGIFTVVYGKNVPVVHPQMRLVIQYEFEAVEAGEKKSRIVLLDEDGTEILTFEGKIDVQRNEDGSPTLVNQVLTLNNVPFKKFGRYEFIGLINDRKEITVPFRLLQIAEE